MKKVIGETLTRWNYDTMEEEAPIHEVYSKAKKIVNV